MALEKTGIPADYNSAPMPNWRVCSKNKVYRSGNDEPLSLVIHSYSGVVMGLTDSGSMVYLPDEDLTGLIDVGAQIKIARLQRGLTVASLAKVLGVTSQAIRYWESGVRHPRYHSHQQSLGDVLGIDLSPKAKA